MTTTNKPDASDFPAWWDWDEDGDEIAGAFVRAGRGYTANGERAFVVLDVDGIERTVWLHHKVLHAIFAREVQRRPDKQIAVGEHIELSRLGTRDGADGTRSYVNYRGNFPDGPQDSQADIFGLPQEQATDVVTTSNADSGSTPDDDVPF